MAKTTRKQEEVHRPHIGTFITMTVGLLLFFGSLSQIGKLTDTKDLLSAPQAAQDDANQEQAGQLMRLREEAVAVIGGQTTRPAYYQDEIESSPLPPVNSLSPFGTYGNSGQSRTENRAVPPSNPSEQTTPRTEPNRVKPVAPTRENNRVYSVKENDTLYRIARLCYGDGNKWTLIRDANPQVNPAALRPGQNLIIPEVQASIRQQQPEQTAYSMR